MKSHSLVFMHVCSKRIIISEVYILFSYTFHIKCSLIDFFSFPFFFLILVSLSNSSFSHLFCSLSISFSNCYFQLGYTISLSLCDEFCSLCLSFFTAQCASTKAHCTIRRPRFGIALFFFFLFLNSCFFIKFLFLPPFLQSFNQLS